MRSRGGELSGRTVVVTRARAQARELVDALEARGARVVELPTIELVRLEDTAELDAALRALDRYDAIILGSKNAADVLFDRAAALGLSIDRPLACVGAKTLAYVQQRTTAPAFAPEEHRAEALVALLEENAKRISLPSAQRISPASQRAEGNSIPNALGGCRFLFPRAPEGRELILEALSERGAVVDAVSVYRIVAAAPASAEKIAELEGADTFTFLSGETLRAFLEVVPGARRLLERAKVAVIGPVAKMKADALGVRVDVVPASATVEALVDAL